MMKWWEQRVENYNLLTLGNYYSEHQGWGKEWLWTRKLKTMALNTKIRKRVLNTNT